MRKIVWFALAAICVMVACAPADESKSAPGQIVLSSTTFPVESSCQEITLAVQDSQGNVLTSASPMNFDLPFVGPPYFYASNACTTAGGTISIPAGQSRVTFYVTAPSVVTFNTVRFNKDGPDFNFAFVQETPNAIEEIGASLPISDFVQNQCYPIDYQLWDSSNDPTTTTSVVTFSPTVESPSTGTFHYRSDCSDTPNWTASPASFSAGQSVLRLYYKAGATDTGPTVLSSNNSNANINSYFTASGNTLSNRNEK